MKRIETGRNSDRSLSNSDTSFSNSDTSYSDSDTSFSNSDLSFYNSDKSFSTLIYLITDRHLVLPFIVLLGSYAKSLRHNWPIAKQREKSINNDCLKFITSCNDTFFRQ